MRSVRRKHTAPEMAVRRAIHAAGFRYSLHRGDLPGKPDIVLARLRTVVFVHGCFWHGHTCRAGRRPTANPDYWNAKIDRNMERDAHCIDQLRRLGWNVRVIWSCDLAGGVRELLGCLSKLKNLN
jgi:DNA mismatch endonuclease, patch repair protein